MARYRKKPVVIDAVQYDGSPECGIMESTVPGWYIDALESDVVSFDVHNDRLVVRTLEGQHIASPGDFIIRGVKGELYPCKPDIFAATYESVDAEQEPR